jgi:hypothetical protein
MPQTVTPKCVGTDLPRRIVGWMIIRLFINIPSAELKWLFTAEHYKKKLQETTVVYV